jgi:hypothetical protein
MLTGNKRVRQKTLLTELALSKKEGFITSISIKVYGSHIVTYDPDALLYKEDWYNYNYQQPPNLSVENVIKQDIQNFPNIDYISINLAYSVSGSIITKLTEHITKKYNCRCTMHLNCMTIFAFN